VSDSIILLKVALPPVAFTDEVEAARVDAICAASVVESVHDAETQAVAVAAQRGLRKLLNEVEKARKAAKEPLLDAGRALDSAVAEFVATPKAHELRLATLSGDFQQAELEKQRVAERIASAERERIAREQADAELAIERAAAAERARIAAEQAEAALAIERAAAAQRAEAAALAAAELAAARGVEEQAQATARAHAAAAHAAAREALDLAQAKLRAEAANAEADARLKADLQRQTELAAQQNEAVQTVAAPAKAAGQSVRQEWEITRINEFVLLKARPDLVRKVEFDLRSIKEELARGLKLPGVEARQVIKSGVRTSSAPAINI